MKIKKDYHLKIVSVILSIVSLCATTLYSHPDSKCSLRLHIGAQDGDDTYGRVAIARLQQRLGLEPLSEGQIEEIITGAQHMQDMLPEGRKLPLAEIIDTITSTNLQHPYRVKHKLPPTFVFSPKEVFKNYGDKYPRLIALTIDTDCVTLTSVSCDDDMKDKDVYGKGGCRWYQAGKKVRVGDDEFVLTFEDKLRGNKSITPMLPECMRLSGAMSDKNPWSGVFFAGGKTVFIAREGVDKKTAIRRWVGSSITAGVLLGTYIAGPDMDTAEAMEWIVDEADEVQEALGRPRILATTSRRPDLGSFPHEEWMVTSISVVETMMSALGDEELVRELGIDLDNMSIAIQGFGDVGTGVIKYLSERHPAFLEKCKIVAVSDSKGGIYNKDGLDIEELLRLRELRQERNAQDERFALIEEYRGEFTETSPEGVLFKGATVIIPAAGPNVFTTPEQVDGIKEQGTKMLVEGANNSVKLGIEQAFHSEGVLFLPGPVANFGGILTSTLECIYVALEGEASILGHIEERRKDVVDRIIDVARSNAAWLIARHHVTGRSVYKIHQDAVKEITRRQVALLDELPPEMTEKRQAYVQEGLPDIMARLLASIEIARESVISEPEAQRLAVVLTMQELADNPSLICRLGEEGVAGTRSVKLVENERVVIFHIQEGEAECYQGDLVSKLKASNNVTIVTVGDDTDVEAIRQKLDALNPNVVMLPNRSKINGKIIGIREATRTWVSDQSVPVLGIGYDTIDNAVEHNLYCFYGEDEWEVKSDSITANKSQTDRVSFHEAAQAANRASAIIAEAHHPGMSKGRRYTEVFTLKIMDNGQWRDWDLQNTDAVYLLEDVIVKDAHLLEGAPHMDDTPISTAVAVRTFEGDVTNYIMTTGHRAFIKGIHDREFRISNDFSDEQIHIKWLRDASEGDGGRYIPSEWRTGAETILQKLTAGEGLTDDEEILVRKILATKTRELETDSSDEILGITDTIFCRFPMYDARKLGTDPEYDEIETTYQLIANLYDRHGNKLVIGIPDPRDAHPNHVDTHRVFEAALMRFTQERGVAIPVKLDITPWSGEPMANLYNFISPERHRSKVAEAGSMVSDTVKEAVEALETCQGIVGGELVCTEFGAQPDYDALGGRTSERAYVFWLNDTEAEEPQFEGEGLMLPIIDSLDKARNNLDDA